MTQEQIQSALFNMYDIRNALPASVKSRPLDQENSDYTIGDAIGEVLSFLEVLDAEQEAA
jgi:hypothetical protein